MLEIIIVFAIYLGLQKVLDSFYEKKIREAGTVEEALKHRKKLKNARVIFFICYFVAYIVLSFWLNFGIAKMSDEQISGAIIGFVLGGLMLYFYLKTQRKYDEFMGNVSTFGKRDFLAQHESFALFLRGFEEDNYAKEADLSKKEQFEKFSEYEFMRILKTKCPACAIGMTKETDSPYGATRLYVDDTTWKEDVRELMEKAEEIYILVNERESCIWEIEQTAGMMQKTVFIIDDRQKYENVRDLLKDKLPLPEIPENVADAQHLILRVLPEEPQFVPFENTAESYSKILGAPVPEEEWKIAQAKFKKVCLKILGICFLLMVLFLLITLLFVPA